MCVFVDWCKADYSPLAFIPFEYQGYVGGFIWARLNAGREFPAIGNAAACWHYHLFFLPSSLFTCHLFVYWLLFIFRLLRLIPTMPSMNSNRGGSAAGLVDMSWASFSTCYNSSEDKPSDAGDCSARESYFWLNGAHFCWIAKQDKGSNSHEYSQCNRRYDMIFSK